jgi:hypothetical protein
MGHSKWHSQIDIAIVLMAKQRSESCALLVYFDEKMPFWCQQY